LKRSFEHREIEERPEMPRETVGVDARPRRPLDPVRRPQILAAAVELVREKGLSEIRISDIARRAGISPASVVYYFGTKDQLLAQAITEADDAFYDALWPELEQLPSALEQLARLVVRSSASDWLLWMDLWTYSQRHPDTAPSQRRFHRRWRAALADLIRRGAERGEWQVPDVDATAMRLSALTDGLAVHMVLGDPDHTAERYVEMTLTAAALELGCELDDLRRAAAGCPA
jgi:AcrR family transcriptional regulator